MTSKYSVNQFCVQDVVQASRHFHEVVSLLQMRKGQLAEGKSLSSGHLVRDLNPGRLTPKTPETSLILGVHPSYVGAVKSPSGRLEGTEGG